MKRIYNNVILVAILAFIHTKSFAKESLQLQQLPQLQYQVSAQHIAKDVQQLVDFGTRHTLSETQSNTRGIGAARRWIKREFERISRKCDDCLTVYTQSEVISGEKRIPNATEVVNVIAIQKGQRDPNRYIIMSGDIDSRVTDVMDYTSDSPGANDNASGMAGVLEAARVLSKYQFDASIVYVGLSGEEQGLFGGKIMAKQAQKHGWRIEAVLNNDMIGNIEGINGIINNVTARVFSESTRYVETAKQARIRRFTGGEVDSPSRNLARYIDQMADRYIDNLDVKMIYRLDRFGRGGHHRPFNALGFPAVRIMETNENYHRQHQNIRTENGIKYGDTLDGVNVNYAAKLTSLNVVTMASLASAPPPPAKVTIKGAVSADTQLSWQLPQGNMAQNLAGFKVYWRDTDNNQWQYSKTLPVTDNITLKNIVIDNYFFGVASVSEAGFESPVVFPGAAGSFGDY